MIAPRLLEIVLLAGCALLTVRISRKVSPDHRVTAAAPWLVLGPYAFGSVVGGVGQVEGLMALPLLVMIAAAIDLTGAAPSRLRQLAGGVAAGVLVLLKVLYAPIALCVLALGLRARRSSIGAGGRAATWVGYWLAGSLGVLVAAVAALVGTGAGQVAWVTTFAFPGRVLQPGLFDPHRMAWVAQMMLPYGVPLAILAIPALGTARRRQARAERAALTLTLVTAVNIAPQLPTTYRLLALSVPAGWLASLGLARILAAGPLRGGRALTVALALVTALVVLGYMGLRVGAATYRVGVPRDEAGIYAIGDRLMGDDMTRWRCPVEGRLAPGTPIVVVGDPRMFRAVDARQAMEIHGWSVEMYDATLWAEFTREFERSRPAWVFLDDIYRTELERGAPRVQAALASSYERIPACAGPSHGTWYRGLRAPGPSTPHADGVRFDGLG